MSDINDQLWWAAQRGDEAQVSQLIEQGATVDWKGVADRTAVHAAAENFHNSVVIRLLDAGWSLEARDKLGATALTFAAADAHWDGNQELTKFLLLRGANIDTQEYDKSTPLHTASRKGRKGLVHLLLQCGAAQQIKDKDEKTARDRADDDKIRALFREFNENWLINKDEFLKKAISEKNYDAAVILIFRALREANSKGSDTFFFIEQQLY